MGTKLQNLLSSWPYGAVRLISALKQHGYSQNLLNRYRYSGWLMSVGNGAVLRKGDTPTLCGALFALQQDLKLDVHIGGRSALELSGQGHYARHGKPTVWLFGSVKRLPRWFSTFDWGVTIKYHSGKMFDNSYSEGLKNHKEGEIVMLISDSIRAMAEYLSLVPKEHTLEEGKDLMLGLTNLQPKKVDSMLKACNSIKVKRLFLLLAEECGYRWVKKLHLDSLNLGAGPRNLTPGGKFHKKYQVTVPTSILSEGSNEK